MNDKYPKEEMEEIEDLDDSPESPEILDDSDEGPEEGPEEEAEHVLPALRQDRSLVPLDPLAAYIQEIRKYENLTEEEERELAVKYREEGDLHAAYRLTTANLMLVVRIAMTFKREWQNLMDLIQEGNVGLMKAVKNFDPLRGVRLSAYATWWIKSYILKYILDNFRLVKVGTTNVRRKLLYNLRREKERLEREGFEPSTKLLAEHFGVDEAEVIDVQASLGATDVSVDTPTHAGSTQTPLDTLPGGESPEDHLEAKNFRESFRGLLDRFKRGLKPVEVQLMEERILSHEPRSLREIGDDYKVTREAIRQTEQRLMNKLKEYIQENMPEAADYFKD